MGCVITQSIIMMEPLLYPFVTWLALAMLQSGKVHVWCTIDFTFTNWLRLACLPIVKAYSWKTSLSSFLLEMIALTWTCTIVHFNFILTMPWLAWQTQSLQRTTGLWYSWAISMTFFTTSFRSLWLMVQNSLKKPLLWAFLETLPKSYLLLKSICSFQYILRRMQYLVERLQW